MPREENEREGSNQLGYHARTHYIEPKRDTYVKHLFRKNTVNAVVFCFTYSSIGFVSVNCLWYIYQTCKFVIIIIHIKPLAVTKIFEKISIYRKTFNFGNLIEEIISKNDNCCNGSLLFFYKVKCCEFGEIIPLKTQILLIVFNLESKINQ